MFIGLTPKFFYSFLQVNCQNGSPSFSNQSNDRAHMDVGSGFRFNAAALTLFAFAGGC